MKKIIPIVGLILLIFILAGCNESEPMVTCYDCGVEYLEKYAIWDFYGDKVCPGCAQMQISKYVSQQEDAIDSVGDYGEYIPADEDYMIVEKGECHWCGNYAPNDLRMDNDEPVCIDCLAEALRDEKVAKAIWNYIEG